MTSIIDGQILRSPIRTCNTASKKGIQVDMLKLADLYKPAAMKPNTADPVTAPATPRTRNVIQTMIANVTLDRRSFSFGRLGGRINGTGDSGPMAESWYIESRILGELGG